MLLQGVPPLPGEVSARGGTCRGRQVLIANRELEELAAGC